MKYEITLENGQRRILTDADIRKATLLYYTEIGIEFGTEAVVDIQPVSNEQTNQNSIEYDTHPDDFVATVWFTDDRDTEEWHGVIDTAGKVQYLADTHGTKYHTRAALKTAGVKRFTLETQHIYWVTD